MICFLIKKPLEQCQVPEKSLFCKKKKKLVQNKPTSIVFQVDKSLD